MKLHFLVFKCIHYRFNNQLLSVRKQNYVDMQMDDLPEINFESSLRASSVKFLRYLVKARFLIALNLSTLMF